MTMPRSVQIIGAAITDTPTSLPAEDLHLQLTDLLREINDNTDSLNRYMAVVTRIAVSGAFNNLSYIDLTSGWVWTGNPGAIVKDLARVCPDDGIEYNLSTFTRKVCTGIIKNSVSVVGTGFVEATVGSPVRFTFDNTLSSTGPEYVWYGTRSSWATMDPGGLLGVQLNPGNAYSAYSNVLTRISYTSPNSGSSLIGCPAVSGSPNSLSAGTLTSQLSQLLGASNKLPSGTIGQILQHNGTNWIAKTFAEVSPVSGSTVYFNPPNGDTSIGVSIRGQNGISSGTGGSLSLSGGSGGGNYGVGGGSVSILGGSPTSVGTGGNITIQAGLGTNASGDANYPAGEVIIKAGNTNAFREAGNVNISGGDCVGNPANFGGKVIISGGSGKYQGGNVEIISGLVNQDSGTRSCGDVVIRGVNSTSSNIYCGNISVLGGSSTGSGTYGGDISITGGSGTTQNGSVYVSVGSGTGSTGKIKLAAPNVDLTGSIFNLDFVRFNSSTTTLETIGNAKIAATGLKNLTTVVSTTAASEPVSGQVLMATSSNTAAWQTIPSPSGAASALKTTGADVTVSTAAPPAGSGYYLMSNSATSAIWSTISGTVPSGSAAGQILQWNGSGWATLGLNNLYGMATVIGPSGGFELTIRGGDASSGSAGSLTLRGGNASGSSTVGGSVLIQGGSYNLQGADVSLNGGSGMMAIYHGNVILGAATTQYVRFGGGSNYVQYDTSTSTLSAVGTAKISGTVPDGSSAGQMLQWSGSAWATTGLDLLYPAHTTIRPSSTGGPFNIVVSGSSNVMVGNGGAATLKGGDGNVDGGGVYIFGGSGTGGSYGSITIGLAGTTRINIASSASSSVFMGTEAGYNISSGINNTALGHRALYTVSTGSSNTGVGYYAGYLAAGRDNTFLGYKAGESGPSATGNENVVAGSEAGTCLRGSVSGSVFVGYKSGAYTSNSGCNNNTGVGHSTFLWGFANSGGDNTGDQNLALGYQAMQGRDAFTPTSGKYNTAVGAQAFKASVSGSYNTAVGHSAAYAMTSSGRYNVFLGYQAGRDTTDIGSNCIAIGHRAGPISSNDYQIAIGKNARTSAANTGLISCHDSALGPASAGYFWIGSTDPGCGLNLQALSYTNYSDISLKKDIVPLVYGLKFIDNLHPVEYLLKNPTNGVQARRHMGFIAQQVKEDINAYGIESSIYLDENEGSWGVDYQQIVAPLVKAVQELSAITKTLQNKVSELESEIQTLKSS